MKVLIKVTKSVLEKSKMCGKIGDDDYLGFNCAIALAIRDILPNAWVGCQQIDPNLDSMIRSENDIHSNGIRNILPLPEKAIEFIKKFDSISTKERVRMEPISFEIDFPDELVEKIGIDEVKEILNNSKTLELI